MENSTQFLFVYGSLHSGFKNPAYDYLSQYFELVGTALAKGLLFHNNEFPIAVPVDGEYFIKGELYRIKNDAEFDWAMAQLDDYEGLNVMPGETSLYKRSITTAITDVGTEAAWVYWYNGNTQGMQQIESGNVFDFFNK